MYGNTSDYEEKRRKNRERMQRWRAAHPDKWKTISARGRKANRERIMLASARERAFAAGVPFDLDIEDIVIPETCPILGIPLCAGPKGRAHGNSPTLDRIRPELGYVRGNVAVVSHRANRLKSDATLDDLRRLTIWLEQQLEKEHDVA